MPTLKRVPPRRPTKIQLYRALENFAKAVENANGILVREQGRTTRRQTDLVAAYKRACRLLNIAPAPIITPEDSSTAQAETLTRKHERLVTLAARRGYSAKSCAGLILAAETALFVKEVVK